MAHTETQWKARESTGKYTDEEFLALFRATELPFEDWTHEAHVRMAFLTMKACATFENALENVKAGIKAFNGKHVAKLTIGFHETMTVCWAILIWDAVIHAPNAHSFAEFAPFHPRLLNTSLWTEYYSKDSMFSPAAKAMFVPADLKALPETPANTCALQIRCCS
eukprot:ANDGO_06427.mRNA.1 hypothetical protein